MNARQLEIFFAVMRCGTVTEAARFLRISQPAVSKAIHASEQSLGFKLLRLVKGRLYPTPEAETLMNDANRVMREFASFQHLVADIRAGRTGTLRIAASSTLATVVVPKSLARFRAAWPSTRISTQLLPAISVAELVAMREIDFGLTLSPTHAAGTTIRTLAQTEMICIAPAGHPVLARSVITPADIAPHPLISFGSDTYFGQLLDQAFEETGVKRDVVIQTMMSLTAACYVQNGAGVAIVDSLMRQFIVPGVEWRPFRPRVLLPVSLVTAETQPVSRPAAAFIALLQKDLDADRRALDSSRPASSSAARSPAGRRSGRAG